MWKIIFLILLFSLFIESKSQNIKKVDYKESLILNEIVGKTEDYLFGEISFIRTSDIDNSLFVAIPEDNKIRKFDNKGKFVTEFGRQGRGPGEFLTISYMTIIENELLVFDMFSTRITYFDLNGELIDTETVSYSRMDWPPYYVDELNKDSLLVLNRLEENNKLFELYDREFNLLYSFGNDVIKPFESKYVDYAGIKLSAQTNNILITDRDKFIYAPPLYYGELKEFKQTRRKSWELINTLHGYVKNKVPYKVYDPNQKGINFSIIGHSGSISYAAVFYNVSRGVFRMKDGYILHFTRINVDKKQLFGYEIYDEKYNYEGYRILKESKLDDYGFAFMPLDVKWKDSEDYFYFTDYSKVPTVVKAKVIYK